MSQANAVTDSSGRVSYSVNSGDGFRVGLGGHASVDIDYAEVVDFNFSEEVKVSMLAMEGGRLKNLHLMLCDLGVISDSSGHHLTINLLKMGKVKRNKDGDRYCPNPRFIGAEVKVGGDAVKVVVGSGVSFYIHRGAVYRSSAVVKRVIKKRKA